MVLQKMQALVHVEADIFITARGRKLTKGGKGYFCRRILRRGAAMYYSESRAPNNSTPLGELWRIAENCFHIVNYETPDVILYYSP
jgi:hypothetical protein